MVRAVPAQLVVPRHLVAREPPLRLEMPGEVDEAKLSLEDPDLLGQSRDLGFRRARLAEGAIEPPLESDDPAAERPRPRVDLRAKPPERQRLLVRQLETVGELERVRGAGVVVELGGEGVAGPLAGEEIGDALGRNRLDLPPLEAAVRLLSSCVPGSGVVLVPCAAGRAGDEQDRGDGRRYAAAASQRSQARS